MEESTKMESSKSTQFKILPEQKFQLYYNKYEYKVVVPLFKCSTNSSTFIRASIYLSVMPSGIEYKTRTNHTHGYISFYTNNLDILDSISKVNPNFEVYKIELKKINKVLYFKRKPKGNYRIHFKSIGVDPEDFDDFMNKIRSMDEVTRLPNSFYYYNNYRHNRKYYLRKEDYLDIVSDKNLLYYQLVYGEFLGEIYKLELRPETNTENT